MNTDTLNAAVDTSTVPYRLTLTDEQLSEVVDAARTDWVSAVLLTFHAFGIDVAHGDDPVRCADYAIPTAQWEAIAEACGQAGDSIGRVNRMLDWMNYGPSSFEPERPFEDVFAERDQAHARDCRCSDCHLRTW